ncbi:MAG: TatD family hydrolase [Gemmatimonadota bacterium]|nr:TatD family hydrolase [Gemmatimonadota bacterium]MDH3366317.1 TatD family hydrolase [Gemmatimonadota bacterium]MDH3477057.1 TatD family hydrolase [Gemmatimonadota bacterium]MDH3570880.1 TatD family hydrolase [Gemmatimonadota bacterium]MDH5550173.1 TatD family hydrolase [Gemmatimonadota bacterium]
MLVDTHCHLGDRRFDADRDAVLDRARHVGVGHIVTIADSIETTMQAIALADRYGLSASAGVHPHAASTWTEDVAARIAACLDHPAVVAVGETGLDYHYDYAPRPAQRAAFEAQLALGSERNRPVVVHGREADRDLAAMLQASGSPTATIVLHSFSSGPTVVDAGMAIGAYFSFSGMVTFKNWNLLDVVRTCPADRLLLETDAPYLAPVPHRGRRNEPAFVRGIAERVAELRDVSVDEVITTTTANAGRCFGSRVAQPMTTQS